MENHLTQIVGLACLLLLYALIKGYRKIIFWLADVSGVTKEIENRTMRDIGGRIYQDHYWFNGGSPGAWMVANTLKHYGASLKNLYYPNVNEIRSDVYELGDNYKK
jgi:hypothetical protein